MLLLCDADNLSGGRQEAILHQDIEVLTIS